MPNWTQQQQDAISDRGHSLIVCAAAGSGKTAVLVERIVQLVREGCPVDSMLVVTFTNAAAGEMRLRIGEALSAAAVREPELGVQVMALSRASISTLHRFCSSLLREHFETLGIDPAFRIADEQECGVLSRQAMEDALYSCYEVGSEAFMAADACYTQEELSELALRIDRFMMSRPDPWTFLERAQQMVCMDAKDFEQSDAARMLCEEAVQELSRLHREAERTMALCTQADGPAHYAQACAEDEVLISDLQCAVQSGYEALHGALEAVSFAKLGRAKKGALYDEETAAEVKSRRDALKHDVRSLSEVFAVNAQEAAEDITLTAAPLAGLSELVKTYETLYAAAKRQRGVVDFSDLEHEALRALSHASVRETLRARYRYVFVDEYQDSSAIQEAIVGSFSRPDGLFLVGDVKQSIYRFRQAEPSLFLQKAALFDRAEETGARRIDLQRNFRSRKNVLEAVNAVFERIMRRDVTEIEYDARERLICGLPMQGDDPPVELHLIYEAQEDATDEIQEAVQEDENEDKPDAPQDVQESERELAGVERETLVAAKRIRELVGTPFFDAKLGKERPLAYRDMAILLRAARGSAPMAAEILKSEGIPVFCDAGEGYFDIPEIRAMMALLSVIENGAKDEALLAALRGPALGLTDSELAQIRIFTPDIHTPYHEAVHRYREEAGDELATRLAAFAARLAHWRLCARHQGVDRLIERIYAETGFLAQAGVLPGGAARQANLCLLITRAQTFMQAQGGSLHAFLRYAQRLRAGGDNMSASDIGESEDVVRIMTTHKSKGLEFPVVFVLGMGRRLSGRIKTERVMLDAQLCIGLPCVDTRLQSERETPLRRAMRMKAEREQLAEEVRILYVAMTRARDRLILVGDVGDMSPKEGWMQGTDSAALRRMRTELDMICPVLVENGAALTIAQEQVICGASCWRVFAHEGVTLTLDGHRTVQTVQRMLAALASAVPNERLMQLLRFEMQGGAAVRKLSVSAVLRDEKRAAEDEVHQQNVEIERLPRFMMAKQMTGAQIGTAFHRMMRMIDLCTLRSAPQLSDAVQAQVQQMLACGILSEPEAQAVPVHRLTRFFASPLGVRMLASSRVQREWAFTYRRQTPQGDQLLQGIIDCCFMEKGAWVLVDYKTDSASDVQGALTRHAPQLALYAQALCGITGVPVSEQMLYLVRAGAGYAVNQETVKKA